MDSGSFDSMKVNDLQEFLAKRGITLFITNLRKKDLIQLCEAVKSLDLPVDPDFARQSTAVDLKEKTVKSTNFGPVCRQKLYKWLFRSTNQFHFI